MLCKPGTPPLCCSTEMQASHGRRSNWLRRKPSRRLISMRGGQSFSLLCCAWLPQTRAPARPPRRPQAGGSLSSSSSGSSRYRKGRRRVIRTALRLSAPSSPRMAAPRWRRCAPQAQHTMQRLRDSLRRCRRGRRSPSSRGAAAPPHATSLRSTPASSRRAAAAAARGIAQPRANARTGRRRTSASARRPTTRRRACSCWLARTLPRLGRETNGHACTPKVHNTGPPDPAMTGLAHASAASASRWRCRAQHPALTVAAANAPPPRRPRCRSP